MKNQRKSAALALGASLLAAAPAWADAAAFLAPALAPVEVRLAPYEPKRAPAPIDGPVRLGDVRALPQAAAMGRWVRVDGGYVARLRATADGAKGLRVRLDLGAVPGAMQVRAQGNAAARVETMRLDPRLGPEAWTPWTEGDAQLVELFSAVAPAGDAVRVGAVLHFTTSPLAKAALPCTLSTACPSGDAALDALIAERKKSLMRITFVSGGGGFACSATLVDTPQRPAAYVLTANHCAETDAVARSITALWFYEEASCGAAATNPASTQTAGGMQLVFGSYGLDASLLLMNTAPPAAASYAPLDAARVASGTPVVSLSHPAGDRARWAQGTMEGLARPEELPYDMYVAVFSRGLIQGGSSGSGLFTRSASGLQLSGILSRGPVDPECTMADKLGVYGRMEVFHPQIARYIGATPAVADDAANKVSEVSASIAPAPLDSLGVPVTVAARIDYPGDVDVFRFSLAGSAAFTVQSQGGLDLVSMLTDASGAGLASNDDAETRSVDTGLTAFLGPGTYHVEVAHWQPGGTGPYTLAFRADAVEQDNHTALWWNPAESGWGLNVNHQGNIVFATLFTYDDDGSPLWLVMPRGERQAGGAYSGPLYRTTGPPFNASPWRAVSATEVGTMRIAFAGPNDATLDYGVGGRAVSKSITRQVFRTLPECAWSAFDRSYELNVQDLWWNPAESGWGINLTQQGNVMFATLFTYGADGRGLWLVMPDGAIAADGGVTGALYRTRGPRFDASPWSAATPTRVGTMSLGFDDGNAGTLTYSIDGVNVTKSITRQVFASPRPRCRD